jgi:hypothetical protein
MDISKTSPKSVRFSTLVCLVSIGLQTGCATLVGGMTMTTHQDYEIVDTKGPNKVQNAEPHESVLRLANVKLESDRVLVNLEEHNLCMQSSVFTDKYRRTSVAVDSAETGPIPDIVSMPVYVAGTYGLGWGAMALAAQTDSPFQAQTRTALVMNIIMTSELVVTGIYGLKEFKSENRDETEVVVCSEWAPSTQISEAHVTLGERRLSVDYNTENHTLEVPAAVFGAVMLEHRDLSKVEAVEAQLSIQRADREGSLPAGLQEGFSIDASTLKQQAIPWRCEAIAQPFSAEILDTHPPTHVAAVFDELEATCGEKVQQANTTLCRRSKADALQQEPVLVDTKRRKQRSEQRRRNSSVRERSRKIVTEVAIWTAMTSTGIATKLNGRAHTL